MKEIFITEPQQLRDRMAFAWEVAKELINQSQIVITIGKLTKTRKQEKLYHALIGDIARQVKFPRSTYSAAAWKVLLVDFFEQECKQMGEPLSKPGRLIPSLDGQRLVSMRASTKEFNKDEASNFIEFLFAFGSDHNVKFTDYSLKTYETYKEAA